MRTPALRAVLGLLLAAALPTLAHAKVGENLIVNPDFDEDLDGWDNVVVDPPFSGVWSSDDSQGSEVSGSAQLSITLPDNVVGIYDISSACVAIGEVEVFAFEADYLIPSVRFGSQACVCLEWFAEEDCTTPIDPLWDCEHDGLQNSWMRVGGVMDSLPGALGVRLHLVNFNRDSGDDGGEFVVHFDRVFLPEPSRWAQAFVLIALGALRAATKIAGRGACDARRQASPR